MRVIRRCLIVLSVLLAPATGDGLHAQPLPAKLLPDERNTIEVFRRVAPAVVFIKNAQVYRDWFRRNVMEQPLGTGSGFVWDRRGHIVTNYHVIREGNSFTVTFADGSSYRAELVGSDPNKDLAVLRIDASVEDLAPLDLADSSELRESAVKGFVLGKKHIQQLWADVRNQAEDNGASFGKGEPVVLKESRIG